jgi:RNA polymerase sigma factor (sigma-70 family)
VDGEGIGKVDGYTLFVKDAIVGDVVEAVITKAKKNYGYAKMLNIIEASAHRVMAKCPVARKCGGCQVQELSYEAQLEFKAKKVYGNLQRIGGFDENELDAVMEPICGMDEPFYYRNKAQFPIGTDKEGKQIHLMEVLLVDDVDIAGQMEVHRDVDILKHNFDRVLTEREAYIMRKRYGLFGEEELTQREIAKSLGISRSYVSRIEKKALEKLKKLLTN